MASANDLLDLTEENVEKVRAQDRNKLPMFHIYSSSMTSPSQQLQPSCACPTFCIHACAMRQVLDEVRPYLMADGGNVEFVELDGLVVKLRLQGACGSCPSSTSTMTMGIKRRLMEKIPVRGL